jgi:hypothetical protein
MNQTLLAQTGLTWDSIEDDLDVSLLMAESGYDAQWSSYSGSSTSPGKCC